MPNLSNRPHSHVIVILSVAIIIIGALAMAGQSIRENLRFSKATSQILLIGKTVNTFAKEQNGFNFSPGEDLLAAMANLGRLESPKQSNPWNSPISAAVGANATWRIESIYPVHVCRRIALYLTGIDAASINLIGIDAQTTQNGGWTQIFPTGSAEIESVAKLSCGVGRAARVGLTFRAQ